MRFNGRAKPGEVRFRAGNDRQYHELGGVIGVQAENLFFEFREPLGARFDDQKVFAAVFDFRFPCVDLLNRMR